MTVRVADGMIYLEGYCRVEEAEALLLALQEGHAEVVEVGEVTRMHLALAQILLAARPQLRGVPNDPFLRDWLLPLLHTAD